MDQIRDAVQLVGAIAAIVVLIFGAARWFGRRDEREAVTARDLATKADKHEVLAVSERVREIEQSVAASLSKLEAALVAGLADIKLELRTENAARLSQDKSTGEALTALAVKVGGLEARFEAVSSRLVAIENGVERRRQRSE